MAEWWIIREGFLQAFDLLMNFDPDLYYIIFLSIYVSGTATLLATIIGVPIGALITIKIFPGKEILKNITYTLMGLPSVVAGLAILLLISRTGPFGYLQMLYTPDAIILAQFVLALPIIIAITMSAVSSVSKDVRFTAKSLGASEWQTIMTIIKESKNGIITAIVTTLSTCISEVGAASMVGGNIEGVTRVLTTATITMTSMGYYGYALALGMVLLIITFIINLVLLRFQARSGTLGEQKAKKKKSKNKTTL